MVPEHVSYWMQEPPEEFRISLGIYYFVFLRTGRNKHFAAGLDTLVAFSMQHDHNNPDQGPTYAELRVDGEHLIARSFHPHARPNTPYNLKNGHMPLNNHIYVLLPNGAICASKLEKHQANHTQT